MTEALQSPDHLMGGLKRRNNFGDDEDMESYGAMRSFGVVKRSRMVTGSTFSGSSGSSSASTARFVEDSENLRPISNNQFFENDRQNKMRKSEVSYESSTNCSTIKFFQDQAEQLQKYHDSQQLSLKTECQMNMEKVQRDYDRLRCVNKTMSESSQALDRENKTLKSENTVINHTHYIQYIGYIPYIPLYNLS